MKIKIPLQIVELEDNNYHIIASCKYEDGTKGYWAIDTGASKTVFDKNLNGKFSVFEGDAEEIHTAGISERPLETTLAILAEFNLGKLKVKNQKVALLDLSHINKLYKKATNIEICGLIGGDFLMHHRAIVNYKKKILVLET